MTVASLYPEVIRTIILQDANMLPLMPETPAKQKWMALTKAGSDSVRANLVTGGPEKAARELLERSGPGAWGKAPARVKQITLDNIGTATDSGERGKFSCANIQKFNFPILLLTGERSPKLYGEEMIAVMRQCKPDIPAPLIVPNGTHSMHRDNPEFFNKAVLDFLNQH
jgi:pimeloyl-ACP methyl ester carboxylesterase